MPKCQVLLSAYNGLEYFPEQIDSLLNQTYNDIEIFIRDDGSTDKSFSEYLHNINEQNICVEFGENKGTIKSFFSLLEKSNPDAEYFAFCDQDDYWLADKVSNAIELLKKNEDIPVLYCSDAFLVDKNLNSIGKKFMTNDPNFNLRSLLIFNSSLGCTCVFNKKLRDIILSNLPNYNNVIMHDWWCALVASCTGKIIYDNRPGILYRQHGKNQIGADSKSNLKRTKKIVTGKKNTNTLPQIFEFCKFYKKYFNETSKYNSFFENNNSMFNRFKYSCKFKFNSLKKTILFRLLFTFNYYKLSNLGDY